MIEVYAIDKETKENIILGYCEKWKEVIEDLEEITYWDDLEKPKENYYFGAVEV